MRRLLSYLLCIAIIGTTIFPDGGTAFAASIEESKAAVAETTETSQELERFQLDTETAGEGLVNIDRTIENDNPRFGEPETGELESEEIEESAIIGEDLDRRDQYQKEYMLEDNTRLLVVYPDAVHYEKNGKWEEIDNTLVTARKADGTTVLKNTASVLDVELPQTMDQEQEISLTYED